MVDLQSVWSYDKCMYVYVWYVCLFEFYDCTYAKEGCFMQIQEITIYMRER